MDAVLSSSITYRIAEGPQEGRYDVRGVATGIVNSKYRVSASLAGGYEQVMQVAEALAAREHQAAIASN